MPKKGMGSASFMRGYFKRIPVYVMFFALSGFLITIMSTLAIGGGGYMADIPLTTRDIRSQNAITWETYHGYVGGYITLDLRPFWAVFSGDPAKTEILLMFPQLEFSETKPIKGLAPVAGGFPMRGSAGRQGTGSDLHWGSDGSGTLKKYKSWDLDMKDLKTRPDSHEFRFSGIQDSGGKQWFMALRDKVKIRDGTWPCFQFAVQIVEDNKIVWATSKAYDCRAHLDSDGDPVFDPLIITEGNWEPINGEIVPELIWPDDNPEHLTDGIWGEIWQIRGSMPTREGASAGPPIIDVILAFFGFNIFDTEWSGPLARGGLGGFIFWVTGMEFLFVDLMGLVPYVTGTNYQHSMDGGENFGFWVLKVGFDLAPALVIAGILGWILVPMLPSLIGASLSQIVREIPKFVITIPRRTIFLLLALIGLTFSGFGLVIGLLKIGPALILFTISTTTFVYSILSDTGKITRKTIIFLIFIPTFFMGWILFALGMGIGLAFIVVAFFATGLEILSSPFAGLGRTVTSSHTPQSRKKRITAYKKMQRKLNIKR